MMKSRTGLAYHKLLSGGLFLMILVGIFSCDNSEKLGLEVTPPGERFAYHIDSGAQVWMQTLRQDSLTTEKRSAVLLGAINDPVFGQHQSSFLTQLRLSSNDVDFGQNIQVDSAVLILKYHGYYGDTTHQQKVRVFEMKDDLIFDSTYYSNLDRSTFFDPALVVAEKSYFPTPGADSLSIAIDHSIAQKILEADTSNLKDNTAFLNYFKGLYLQSESVNAAGSLSYFNLAGGKSKMVLYYSNSEEDSLSYELVINENCTWVNLFDHNYTNSEVAPYINDSIETHNLVYIQAMSGLRAGIRIDFSDSILAMADLGIAINKAELVFPIAPEYVSDYRQKPLTLAVFGAALDGTNEFIDDIFLGESYYDGSYHPDKDSYVFNIARHIQNILNPDLGKRKENRGLFLVINDSRVSANSLVLKNGNQEEGVKLIITYTLIN